MADTNYPIEQDPVYDPNIRALQDTDPTRASTIFNPLFKKIINNVHAVKLASDGKATTSHASTATTYGVASVANYGHVMASSATPLVAGTATVGTDNGKYAREGHVHPVQTSVTGSSGNCTGNAATATKLQTARTINGVSFDGTANITVADSTKAPTSHASSATTYGVASASNYGHAMASSAIPLAAGTADVGKDNGRFAREGHVHPQTMAGYNYIINGDFRIWQRGESFAVAANTVRYTADRFKWACEGGAVAQVVRENPGTINNCLRLNITTGGTTSNLRYHFETSDCLGFIGKKLTLTIEASASSNVTCGIGPFDAITTNDIMVITSNNYTITSERKKHTLTFSINGITNATSTSWMLQVLRIIQSGWTGTIRIYNVKLEIGDAATPFVPRLEAEELVLCQRYYEKGIIAGTGGHWDGGYTRIIDFILFPVPKRVPPTITWSARNIAAASSGANIEKEFNKDIITDNRAIYVLWAKPSNTSFPLRYYADYVADAEF